MLRKLHFTSFRSIVASKTRNFSNQRQNLWIKTAHTNCTDSIHLVGRAHFNYPQQHKSQQQRQILETTKSNHLVRLCMYVSVFISRPTTAALALHCPQKSFISSAQFSHFMHGQPELSWKAA